MREKLSGATPRPGGSRLGNENQVRRCSEQDSADDLQQLLREGLGDSTLNLVQVLIFRPLEELTALLSEQPELVSATDEEGRTLLHWALQMWRTDVAEELLRRGAEVDCRENNGFTPLHVAAWVASKKGAEMLISAGANVHTKDSHGLDALHVAFSDSRLRATKPYETEPGV